MMRVLTLAFLAAPDRLRPKPTRARRLAAQELVTIWGAGFTPGKLVELEALGDIFSTRLAAATTADARGSFEGHVQLSEQVWGDVYKLTARDSNGVTTLAYFSLAIELRWA